MVNLLTVLRNSVKYTRCDGLALSGAHVVGAKQYRRPSQSGYVNMPSAAVDRALPSVSDVVSTASMEMFGFSSASLSFLQIAGRYGGFARVRWRPDSMRS